MSAMKTGVCINPNCSKARSKEKQTVLSANFVCECGWELRESKPDKERSLLKYILAIFLVSGVAAFVYKKFYHPGQESPIKNSTPIGVNAFCPSSDLSNFLKKKPSPDEMVKAAMACADEKTTNPEHKIRFEITNGEVIAFNIYGDKLTQFHQADTEAWQRIIDKYLLLSSLTAKENYNKLSAPVKIEILQDKDKVKSRDGKVYYLDEKMDFSFSIDSSWRYFLLFDLAGDGQLQLLYPLESHKDPMNLSQVPYKLTLKVSEPTGEDDLVAVFCANPQNKALDLLKRHDGASPPTAGDIISNLDKDCQIGNTMFFSRKTTQPSLPESDFQKVEASTLHFSRVE